MACLPVNGGECDLGRTLPNSGRLRGSHAFPRPRQTVLAPRPPQCTVSKESDADILFRGTTALPSLQERASAICIRIGWGRAAPEGGGRHGGCASRCDTYDVGRALQKAMAEFLDSQAIPMRFGFDRPPEHMETRAAAWDLGGLQCSRPTVPRCWASAVSARFVATPFPSRLRGGVTRYPRRCGLRRTAGRGAGARPDRAARHVVVGRLRRLHRTDLARAARAA